MKAPMRSDVITKLARRSPALTAYAVAVLAGLATWLIAALVLTLVPDAPVLLLFAPVVCAAAVLGGLGPALGVTLVGVVAGFWLTQGSAPYLFAVVGTAASCAGAWFNQRQRSGDNAARELASREAHLRSIYDTAPDALIVIDAKGIIQSYSAAAERMFQWGASEVLGRNIKMLMPHPYRDAHDSYVNHYLDTGQRRIIGIGRIVVGERKDGTTFPMELAVGEVRSEEGRVFTGFLRDLTERQATEARLQELQSELVHMSRLTAMGEMASALAHELNQPLTAIANYLGGVKRILERSETVEPRVADALEKAGDQALRAGEVIRRLRDFLSRGESERGVHSLSKLVQEACALALVGAKEQDVRVLYTFDRGADRVLVDRVPVQQVILNLVRNALDALENHALREIQVTTSAHDGLAMVSVSDTGPGVAEAAASRLFEPFVTTKADGMGVGLSISRTIVEAHGGRIWMEPNPRGGATFMFTVPLASDGAPLQARL